MSTARAGSTRLVVVGAGGLIGSATAFAAARDEVVDEIVLVDANESLVTAHAWDMETLTADSAVRVRVGSLDDLAQADVAVLCLAAPQPLDRVRGQNLEANASLLGELVPFLSHMPPNAATVVATNPVDPLVTLLSRELGREDGRLLGYTANDTWRLRVAVGRVLEVAPTRVEAWVVGEHGHGQVPVLSHIRLDGAVVELSDAQRLAARDEVHGWFGKFQQLKSGRSSQWASGAGLTELTRHLLQGSDRAISACVPLAGAYGVDDLALGTPVAFTQGRAVVRPLELDEGEQEAFEAAASAVREALAAIS